MIPPAVEVRHLVKEFVDGTGQVVRAVDDVSLAIREGEFFALLGPSGCGKTTTLRAIAGFEDPTSGEVLLRGAPVLGVPAFHRPVNTVFQDYALFPHMTVLQNVTFGLRMARVPAAEAQRRALAALEMVHLPAAANRRPSQLSGGQKQRVALARALVNRPAVLLLDEPLGALDLKLRKAMQLELKQLQQEVGITFIYVTHDQEEALTMADRIAVMSAGEVLQVGTPDEIYERPSSRFVADFIGETNFLEGTLEARRGDLGIVRLRDDAVVEATLRDPNAEVGRGVAVAVRPEKIDLVPRAAPTWGDGVAGAVPTGEAATGETALTRVLGSVVDVHFLGTDTRYRVRVGEAGAGYELVVRAQNRLAGHAAMLARGTDVTVTWRRDQASVLA